MNWIDRHEALDMCLEALSLVRNEADKEWVADQLRRLRTRDLLYVVTRCRNPLPYLDEINPTEPPT